MYSEKFLNIILIISVAIRCVSTDEYDSSLKYIVDYMKNYLSTYQVTVVVQLANNLTPFGSGIVTLITDEFSSIVIDIDVDYGIPVVRPYGNLWDRAKEQSKLKVALVEIHEKQDILLHLRMMIFHIITYSGRVRGKCMIFLINGKGQSLEHFLRFAWSLDFLDITVVEWVNTTQTQTLTTTETLDSEVLVHIFDPFQDKYTKERLSNTTNLLPCKARNLHGYRFRGIANAYPGVFFQEYFRNNEVKLMNYLTDGLNFTTVYPSVIHDAENESRGFFIDFDMKKARRRMKLAEKILLVTLYFVSIVMMTLTSDELLKMSMSKREVLRLTNLEELTDSSMSLHTDKRTRDFLSSFDDNYPKLQKIANRSIVVASSHEALKIFNPRAPLNLIFMILSESLAQSPHVVELQPDLYLTFLKENIATQMEFMTVRENFPLKERFAQFFLKLSESGLMMRHEKLKSLKWYSAIYADGRVRHMHTQYGPENDKDEEVSLNLRLLIILVPGYVLACIVLIWEIFFKS
ncbi:hypothetical protein QAD02_010926 [Eretmocerus hayati]|uniref:Uncharacterized protein n=1 Tax=Eretmocerus hayati TaxID=131215 RepID=A0ACC2NVB6_9HYME|nr:hypothetical protein QAD02_010926 [Eretmocerus hayati]